MKFFYTICFNLLLLLPAFNTRAQILNVEYIHQDSSNWCWNATAKSVLKYYDDTSQTLLECTIAEYIQSIDVAFGNVPCCDANNDCNQGTDIYSNEPNAPTAQNVLLHFGNIHTRGTTDTLTADSIKTYIQKTILLLVRWGWFNSDSGHTVIIYGYINEDSLIYYIDPENGYQTANYDWFFNNRIYPNSAHSDQGATLQHQWTNTLIPENAPTGIAQLQVNANQLSVFPNPSTGQFTVQLPPNQIGYEVDIYNVLGETVYQSVATNNQNNININNQPAGMYFIYLRSGETVEVGKVMIAKQDE